MAPRSKKVSLVILTCNRAEGLLRTVAQALALPERPPLVVVDNGSSDGTPRRLKERHPEVKLVRTPFNLGAAARNLGVHCAETPYVAFSDDDTAWEAGSLETAAGLLDFFPRVAALSARVLVGPEGRESPASAQMAASPLSSRGLPGPGLLGFLAGASVFRRKAFLEAGGYEPRLFLGGEETLLAYDLAAAGWSFAYCDKLTVHQSPSPLNDWQARRRLLRRNELWVAWLRRPLGSALRLTLRSLQEHRSAGAMRDALAGIGWVLRNRRVIPPQVEAQCRLLEAVRQAAHCASLRASERTS